MVIGGIMALWMTYPAQEVRDLANVRDPRRGNGSGPSNRAAMAPNIIGLGLIVAGVIFMIIGGIVLWILGAICLIGGVGALWMTLAAEAPRCGLTPTS